MPTQIAALVDTRHDQVEQVPDRPVCFQRMPQASPGMDDIAVLATDPLPLQISRLLQLGHDTLHCALRDADRECHLAQGLLPIPGQTNQDMGMIRKKIPLWRYRFRHSLNKSRLISTQVNHEIQFTKRYEFNLA